MKAYPKLRGIHGQCESFELPSRNPEIIDPNSSHTSSDAQFVFRSCYATVLKKADARYDVRGYLLSELVSLCLGNRATLPLTYRARYQRLVQREAIAFVESFTAQLLFGSGRFSPHEYRYRVEGQATLADIRQS